MPTSSTSARPQKANLSAKKPSYWSSERVDTLTSQSNNAAQSNSRLGNYQKPTSFLKKSSSKYTIKHISAPSSASATNLTAGSMSALNNSQHHNHHHHHHHHSKSCSHIVHQNQKKPSGCKANSNSSCLANQLSTLPSGARELDEDELDVDKLAAGSKQTLSLSGHLVSTASGPSSLISNSLDLAGNSSLSNKNSNQLNPISPSSSSSYIINNKYKNLSKMVANSGNISTVSLQQQLGSSSTANSTAQLHGSFPGKSNNSSSMSIQRSVSLKYIKSIIISLIAIDLLITVFVHQFAAQDQLTFWFMSSFKMRLSLLNLILSSVWFVVLIGAILFEVYFLLVISCLVNALSFLVLLVFSVVHFSRRIDYNQVNLSSLLALLFSIVMLHVYLLVLGCLMVYLTMLVKRRRHSSRK